MKKVFVFCLLLAGVCGASAQNELTKVGEVSGTLRYCPSEFLYEGKAHFLIQISNPADDPTDDTYTFEIYNSDIELEKTITLTDDWKHLDYRNLNTNNSGEDFEIYLSQTLFNQDDKWEWVALVENEDGKYAGLKVMQEGDVELCSLDFDTEYSRLYLQIWLLDDKVYLVVELEYPYDGLIFYQINSGEEASIKYVGKVKGLSISPTILERSTPVTIEFVDDTEATHKVTVTSASGQVVQRLTVAAGQTSVSLNTSSWGKGMNIVTTKNSNNETESCKLIVK
ncbi:MAG: T9SS type A sorting domain-containing protein [Prevotellaceae bacterium]|nr:T9SS type A sorting domain-containing protein [Prevotellaceae bacterium]